MSKKIFKLENWDLIIAGCALVLLSSLTFISIFTRYFFHEPFMFLEEVQKALLLWITIFSGCACFRYKQHVAIEVVVEMLPHSIQKLIKYLIVCVLIFMTIYSFKLCQMHFNAHRVTNVLQFPMWIIYSAVPIGCISMIYQCIKYELLPNLRNEKGE